MRSPSSQQLALLVRGGMRCLGSSQRCGHKGRSCVSCHSLSEPAFGWLSFAVAHAFLPAGESQRKAAWLCHCAWPWRVLAGHAASLGAGGYGWVPASFGSVAVDARELMAADSDWTASLLHPIMHALAPDLSSHCSIHSAQSRGMARLTTCVWHPARRRSGWLPARPPACPWTPRHTVRVGPCGVQRPKYQCCEGWVWA